MFSMFGRTGAPTKRAPTTRGGNFCIPEIMGDSQVNESDEQKKVAGFLKEK